MTLPLEAICEALLWAAPAPVTVSRLAEVIGCPQADVAAALDRLAARYLNGEGGLEVQKVAGGFQICTRPAFAPYIEKLVRPRPQALSQAALETLAVVAYMQPVTRADVEAVRGVNSEAALHTLLDKKVVQEVGRKDTLGRPILYGTTPDFLRLVGLDDVRQLPPLESFSEPAPEPTPVQPSTPDSGPPREPAEHSQL